MITFIPQGGLCNRMRSLDAAISLAHKAETSLIVQWHKDPGLNADLHHLFELPECIIRVDTISYNDIFAQLRKSIRKRIYKMGFDYYFSNTDIMELYNDENKLIEIASKNHICIAACMRFINDRSYYRHLKPLPNILDEVKKAVERHSDLVGVHVRRADHQVATRRSPLSSFVDAMEAEIEKNQLTKFFVASDSDDIVDKLVFQFPGRIITFSKTSLARDRETSIIDAMIDLYSLSRTRKIIGSYSSSFSEEAAKIGNIELMTIDIDDAVK